MKRALQTSPPVVPKPVTSCPAGQVCPASARLPGSPFSPLSFQAEQDVILRRARRRLKAEIGLGDAVHYPRLREIAGVEGLGGRAALGRRAAGQTKEESQKPTVPD